MGVGRSHRLACTNTHTLQLLSSDPPVLRSAIHDWPHAYTLYSHDNHCSQLWTNTKLSIFACCIICKARHKKMHLPQSVLWWERRYTALTDYTLSCKFLGTGSDTTEGRYVLGVRKGNLNRSSTTCVVIRSWKCSSLLLLLFYTNMIW